MSVSPDDRKRKRYQLHHWLSSRSVRGGAGSCMTARDGVGEISVSRHAGGQVHVAGVKRCASVWSCPVCAPVIRERRGTEIDLACARALADGLQIAFVTATVSHHLGDSLKDVLGLVMKSWRGAFGGRAAQETLAPMGYAGQVRNIEVTHGDNGWHPHIHALVFVERGADVDALLTELGTRFVENVSARGGVSMFPGPGWKWSMVTSASAVAKYLAKVDGGWGIGMEMTRGDLKTGKGATPMDLLEAAAAGDLWASTLFRIYEEGTRTRHFMRWTPGLRDRLGVNVQSDEEAAVNEPETAPEATWRVPVAIWHHWRSAGLLWVLLLRAQTCPDHVDLVTGELLVT